MAASFSYTGFTLAKSRRTRKGKEKGDSVQTLKYAAEALEREGWMSKSLQIVRDVAGCSQVTKILCLGLGSPSSSVNARAQCGFLLRLCDTFSLEPSQVAVYDPVFTEADFALLAHLRLVVELQYPGADYFSEGSLLVYMPHCELELHEELLINVKGITSQSLLLISNPLQTYVENNPHYKLEQETPNLLRLGKVNIPFTGSRPIAMSAPLVKGHELPISSNYPGAFNNTAVQMITGDVLKMGAYQQRKV